MTAEQTPERTSRVDREILEILDRADAAPRPAESLQTAFHRTRAETRSQLASLPTLSLSRFWTSSAIVRIVASLGLAIGAAAIADVSRLLSFVLAIASAIAFFSLWVPARPSGLGSPPTRWRGRDLGDDRH